MIMTEAQRQRQAYGLNQPQAFNRIVGQHIQDGPDQTAYALAQLQRVATGNALREQAAVFLQAQHQQQGSSAHNAPYMTNLSTPHAQPQPPQQLTPLEIARIAASAATVAFSNIGTGPSSGGPPPASLPAGPSRPGFPLPNFPPPGFSPQGSANVSESESGNIEWASPPLQTTEYPAFGPKRNQVTSINTNSPTWQVGEAFLPISRDNVPGYGSGYPAFRGDPPGYWFRQSPKWRQLPMSVGIMGAWKPLKATSAPPRHGQWIFTPNVNVPRSLPPWPGDAITRSGNGWRVMGATEAIPSSGVWTVHGGAWTRVLPESPNQGSWLLDRQRAMAAADRALLSPRRRTTPGTNVSGPSHQQ